MSTWRNPYQFVQLEPTVCSESELTKQRSKKRKKDSSRKGEKKKKKVQFADIPPLKEIETEKVYSESDLPQIEFNMFSIKPQPEETFKKKHTKEGPRVRKKDSSKKSKKKEVQVKELSPPKEIETEKVEKTEESNEEKVLAIMQDMIKAIATLKIKSAISNDDIFIHSESEKYAKRLAPACFRRLKQVLKNGNSHTVQSARHIFTVDDFRLGCKYYHFEHPYDNSSGLHLIDILKKESVMRGEKCLKLK